MNIWHCMDKNVLFLCSRERKKIIQVWSKSSFLVNDPFQSEGKKKDILKLHAGRFELAKGKNLLEGNLFIKIMC